MIYTCPKCKAYPNKKPGCTRCGGLGYIDDEVKQVAPLVTEEELTTSEVVLDVVAEPVAPPKKRGRKPKAKA